MPRTRSRPLLSVVLMLGATAAFVAMQAVVKTSRERGMATTEVMFFRTAPGLPVLWWLLRRSGQGLTPAEPGNVLVRSVLGTCAMGTNFLAMLWLTLAQFSTLHLTQPVFVALAAPLLLRERVRPSTWAALVLALTGASVLVVPGLRSSIVPLWPALLALSSALFSTFAQIWVRKATASDPPVRVVFHFAALVSVLSLVLGLATGHFRHVPGGTTTPVLVLLVAGMAGFGTLGQVLMTRAYSHGEAASVSIVAYAGIGLALLADLVLWDVVPAATALLGALLMVVAGFVLVRGGAEAVPESVR